jgi:3-oxoadipate enol-lactonase
MKTTINGANLEYETHGPRTGVPVVLIHGFPFSKEMWAPQVEVLRDRYYVVTYDVRGHGKSDAGDGQYSVELFVDDLIGLLDHLRIGRAVLVGLSMGGYIALRAVERNPDRVRALVLCDTRSEADGNEGKIKRAVQARAVKADGLKDFAKTFVRAVFAEKTFETNPAAVSMIQGIVETTSPLAVAGTLLALAARTDTTASLFTINVPVLLLVGKHDALTPPSASEAMKDKIPQARLRILPHAGHLSNLEAADAFNEELLTFLGSV